MEDEKETVDNNITIEDRIEAIEKKAEDNKNEIITEIKSYIDDVISNKNKESEEKLNTALEEKKEVQAKLKELEKDYKKIKEKSDLYKEIGIDSLYEAYDIYQSLSDDMKEVLSNIFEKDSFLGFISNAMHWSKIVCIREQAKSLIPTEYKTNFVLLRKLFVLLANIYNEGYKNPPYPLITPKKGDEYCSDIHIANGYETRGKVTELLLEGYVDKDNNVTYKAIVNIK